MLMCRCKITKAIEEGKIVILEGKENGINILKSVFNLTE